MHEHDFTPASSKEALKPEKSVIASSVRIPMVDTPSQSNAPNGRTKFPAGRRLIIAAALIGLAIGALAIVDRLRDRPARPAPAHEPSLALITTPAESAVVPGARTQDPVPPPPNVVSNEVVAP